MKIIRDKTATGDHPCLDFSVYLSTKDKTTVCGLSSFDYQTGPDTVAFFKSPYGVPVEQAFELAKSYAGAKGIRYIFVEDREGLFPEAVSGS